MNTFSSSSEHSHTVEKSIRITKMQFFVVFWTLVLGPFEYYILRLPFASVLFIRIIAVASNVLWYKYWFERNFWTDHFAIRILRMVTMKFLVNVTNFSLLLGITTLLAYAMYDTGLHFTPYGFVKKVCYITTFAVFLTWPYEKLLQVFGFEENEIHEVDSASDI